MSKKIKNTKERQISIEFLEKHRIEEATRIVSEAFVHLNSMWIKLGTPYEEAHEFNRFRVMQGFKKNWSFVSIY